jgi:hypothetical protein
VKSLPLSLVSLALLWAAPAFADMPSGVFTGTLGKSKIVTCFDERAAAYYYVRIGVDIPLVRDKSGRWKEQADGGKSTGKSTGTWKLTAVESETLGGTWTSPDGKRSLPIQLQLAPAPADGDASSSGRNASCQSPAYNAPRLTDGARTPGKQETKGWLSFRSFTMGNNDVTGLELVGGANLAPLKQAVENLNRELFAGYFDCLSSARESNSAGSEYSGGISVEGVTLNFVVIQHSVGYFCGGAHPDGFTNYLVFERKGGKPVNLEDWVQGSLDALGRQYWKNDDKECGDALSDDTTFVVRPSADGLTFQPQFPHVIEACATDVTVPYVKLANKLTPAGKRATAEFAKMVK